MPEVGQLRFSTVEVLRILLKDQGITEGYWQLIANFGFKALNAPGDVPGELRPAALATLNHLGIQKVERAVPGVTVDAATGESVGSIEELQAASEEAN